MKRRGFLHRTPLKRSTTSRRRDEPGRDEWKEPHAGYCQCGCDRFVMHLERHHVVYEQHVRAEHGRVFDLANSMLLAPRCHVAHHSGQRRLLLECLPEGALAFAVDLFGGDERAAQYVRRYYRTGRAA